MTRYAIWGLDEYRALCISCALSFYLSLLRYYAVSLQEAAADDIFRRFIPCHGQYLHASTSPPAASWCRYYAAISITHFVIKHYYEHRYGQRLIAATLPRFAGLASRIEGVRLHIADLAIGDAFQFPFGRAPAFTRVRDDGYYSLSGLSAPLDRYCNVLLFPTLPHLFSEVAVSALLYDRWHIDAYFISCTMQIACIWV